MRDNWRKQFQQKIDGFEQPVPNISWSDIDKALEAKRTAYNLGEHRFAVWTRRIAAAAVLLLICVSAIFYVSEKNAQLIGMEMADNNRATIVERKVSRQAVDNMSSKEQILANNLPSSQMSADNLPSKARCQSSPATVPPATYPDDTATDSAVIDSREVCPEEQKTEVSDDFRATKTYSIDKRLTAKARQSAGGRISAGVYVQNITGGALNTNSTNGQRTFMNSMSYPAGDVSTDLRDNSFPAAVYSEEGIADADHNMPIRVGVSIRYHIDDRWSVESGVVYSYLRSNLETISGSSFTQKLRYIGVPLTASYSVWQNNNFNTYVTAGGMAEQLVDGTISGGASGSLSSNRLQWSLTATAGIEYNFNNTFGIYAEPGVRYYPDNHDDIINIYKDKPCIFNLNIGIRLNFK